MNGNSDLIQIGNSGGKPVVSGSFGLPDFRSDFGHCSTTADLFSKITSSAIGVSGATADDLSTVLNELLEWGFHCAADEGQMQLRVSQLGESLRLCLSVPMSADSMAGVVERLAELDPEQARECFVLELAKPMREASPLMGLYWLAGEYGQLHALSDPHSVLQLAVDLQR